ncbi:hypothetical protein [Methylobacterium aquaticum]|uniref:hypothetical protein n=1 Tax=Methylobacterium aquaticum TaxID=270351 RepID=UPI001AEC600D|nr:hypothetical protein [Methylobacterium aquaticum]
MPTIASISGKPEIRIDSISGKPEIDEAVDPSRHVGAKLRRPEPCAGSLTLATKRVRPQRSPSMTAGMIRLSGGRSTLTDGCIVATIS